MVVFQHFPNLTLSPIVSRRKSRHSVVGGGISEMSWSRHRDPGWGFFGFSVMFRPPLGITNFQHPDVLQRGGGICPPIGDQLD